MKSEIIPIFSTIMQQVDFDDNGLNKQLEDYAYKLKKNSQGRMLTNRGGFQSKLIDMGQPPVVCEKFLRLVMPEIDKYIQKYNLKSSYSLSVGELWFNIRGKGHYNTPPQHVHSDFSAVYYVKATDDAGDLEIETPDLRQEMKRFYWSNRDNFEYNAHNSLKYVVTPKPGRLVVVPSHMRHMVERNETDEDRISLAFDMLLHTVNINDVPQFENGQPKSEEDKAKLTKSYNKALGDHASNQIGLMGRGDSKKLSARNTVWKDKFRKKLDEV